MNKSVKLSTLMICMLSTLLLVSVAFSIDRQCMVEKLQKHYDESIIINHRMLEAEKAFNQEALDFRAKKIYFDSLVYKQEQEAKFVSSATFAEAIRRFSNDQYNIGGGD